MMNILDGASLAYVAYGAARGFKRGVADEAYRLVRIVVGFVAGCGLYGAVSHFVGGLLKLGPAVSAPASFLLTFVGSFSLLRMFRRRLETWLAARFAGPAQKMIGAAAGFLRTVAILVTVVTGAHLSGLPVIKETMTERSAVGRAVTFFLPDTVPPPPAAEPVAPQGN